MPLGAGVVIIEPFGSPDVLWGPRSMPALRAAPILRPVLVLSLATLVVVQFAALAWAWGRVGHRVIARLAERHLTDQAKAEIRALLEPGESLADASTWADEHCRQLPKPAPWN